MAVAVDRFLTQGQAAATEAVAAMLASGVPHAMLIVGPGGVGKTTLALDLAAALLCRVVDPAERPCRVCRGCRAVEHGNHPDLHRLAPVGPGAVIPIGGGDQRGVRELIRDLALMPVEGGARVAVIESAHRMTEDAQSAFLKTLEEPPAGAVLILCAEDEERLLPTIRSRCVRLRLGSTGARAIERILADRGAADAPTAARLARIAGGRPGVAVALAGAPDAVRLRGEIARHLLDLLAGTRTERITDVRDLAGRAAELARALGQSRSESPVSGRRKGRPVAVEPADPVTADAETVEEAPTATARVPAAERRAAALALVDVWRDVARDLAVAGLGELTAVRNTDLLDDLEGAARRLSTAGAGRFLDRLDAAGEQLEGNVSPELVLDVLALAWHA